MFYANFTSPYLAEAPRERPKLQLAKRSENAEASEGGAGKSSSIFGGAKPVNTAKKEEEIAAKLAEASIKKKEDEEREKAKEKPKQNLFGAAKPVDTAAKEREIEEKLRKQREEAEKRREEGREKGQRDEREG